MADIALRSRKDPHCPTRHGTGADRRSARERSSRRAGFGTDCEGIAVDRAGRTARSRRIPADNGHALRRHPDTHAGIRPAQSRAAPTPASRRAPSGPAAGAGQPPDRRRRRDGCPRVRSLPGGPPSTCSAHGSAPSSTATREPDFRRPTVGRIRRHLSHNQSGLGMSDSAVSVALP